ncbi:MAG: VanW family protein [Clostridia bacterium]
MHSNPGSGQLAQKRSRRGLFIRIWTIVIFTLLVLELVAVGAYIYHILNIDTFYIGVQVNGVHLEGMAFDEAVRLITTQQQPKLDAIKIVLKHGEKRWEYGYEDIDAKINVEEIVRQAYQVGREGNMIDRLKQIWNSYKHGVSFTTTLTYDVSQLRDEVEAIAKEINEEPMDATISFHPDKKEKFSFTEHKIGKGMLVSEAMEELKARVDAGDFTEYELPYEELHPKYTLEELKTWTSRISVYSTKLSGTPERIHNITLSSKAFDGIRIDPGEEFSFNKVTGPRDLKHGYKNAPVIVGGEKLEDEPGGGNCQTSTTLYGAVMRADLKITERWHHSWPSTYTEEGQDATVNYPTADIKFVNDKDTPVFIDRYIKNGRLYVEVYGKAPEEYDKIEIITKVLSRTPAPEPTIVKDPTLYEDEKIEEYKSRPGIKTQTYRVYYKDGKEVKRVKEAYSNYRRIVGKVRVGTKPRPKPSLTPTPPPKSNPPASE